VNQSSVDIYAEPAVAIGARAWIRGSLLGADVVAGLDQEGQYRANPTLEKCLHEKELMAEIGSRV
jgi:hypothetical protein